VFLLFFSEKEKTEEELHLNEMLMTKNKKKLLERIRDEKNKKKKTPKLKLTKEEKEEK